MARPTAAPARRRCTRWRTITSGSFALRSPRGCLLRLNQPAHDAVMRGRELTRQLEMAVMRHRRIEVEHADVGLRVLGAVFARDVDLDALHRFFRIPVITVE